MSKPEETIEIRPAQGRPMLWWVGKEPLTRVPVFPAQHVETFDPADALTSPREAWSDWPGRYPQGGLLFHGDNKEVLGHLLAHGFRGQVKLIYIDPPFDSGADYVRRVQLRGSVTTRLEAEGYSLGEQIQYTDIWANDNYLQFMYERLMLLKELLTEDGSIFLHCDWRRVHHLRCLLDEVFGVENFVNEIIWQHQIMGGAHDKRFPKAHETILWYVKGQGYRLRSEDPNVRVPFSEYVRNTLKQDKDGRWYYERRRMSRKATAEEAAAKAHTRTYVDDPDRGTVATDVWSDMLSYQELPRNRAGQELYPTQKTEKLLSRIVSAATNPGDLILDCFIGSGTTAAVAQKLGRRWIGCDINRGAIQTTSKRLHGIIREQLKEAQEEAAEAAAVVQKELILADGGGADPASSTAEPSSPIPTQYGFTVWRVNDYDLQIQHNEAVHLACEHLGVERMRGDSFFDGLLGKRLVKIIPFGHPLTPLDLEEVRRELEARPEEDRDIVVVSLGKELAADAWLEDWNRHRQAAGGARGGAPNRIEAIELRSDPRYGGIFRHEPATARVRVERREGELVVEVEDFISPTIITRLELDSTLFRAQIPDWRSMVDCVLIDPAYDGEVFNVAVADIPERKHDLVAGRYEIAAPPEPTTVAVKLVDMLGEEVLVVADT